MGKRDGALSNRELKKVEKGESFRGGLTSRSKEKAAAKNEQARVIREMQRGE